MSGFQQVPDNGSAAGATCRLWSKLNLGCGTALGLANPFELHITGRPVAVVPGMARKTTQASVQEGMEWNYLLICKLVSTTWFT